MLKEATENLNQIINMVIRALVLSKIRYRGLLFESCAKEMGKNLI